jgi:hypothetical protein
MRKSQSLKLFEEDKRIPSPKGTARFETPIGKQAQLDWKESIPFETKDGQLVEINVVVLILSHLFIAK